MGCKISKEEKQQGKCFRNNIQCVNKDSKLKQFKQGEMGLQDTVKQINSKKLKVTFDKSLTICSK